MYILAQADVPIFGSYIPSRLIGDCIAVTGALGGVVMLVVSKLQRSHMVLSVYTLLLTIAAVTGFVTASFLFDKPPPALDFSPRNGAHLIPAAQTLYTELRNRMLAH